MIHSQPQGEPIRNHNVKKDFAYTVASVDRAIELLLLLESSARDLGVTELSKLLGVQKSTIHNGGKTVSLNDDTQATKAADNKEPSHKPGL